MGRGIWREGDKYIPYALSRWGDGERQTHCIAIFFGIYFANFRRFWLCWHICVDYTLPLHPDILTLYVCVCQSIYLRENTNARVKNARFVQRRHIPTQLPLTNILRIYAIHLALSHFSLYRANVSVFSLPLKFSLFRLPFASFLIICSNESRKIKSKYYQHRSEFSQSLSLCLFPFKTLTHLLNSY